jgi:hypothetical protein
MSMAFMRMSRPMLGSGAPQVNAKIAFDLHHNSLYCNVFCRKL